MSDSAACRERFSFSVSSRFFLTVFVATTKEYPTSAKAQSVKTSQGWSFEDFEMSTPKIKKQRTKSEVLHHNEIQELLETSSDYGVKVASPKNGERNKQLKKRSNSLFYFLCLVFVICVATCE